MKRLDWLETYNHRNLVNILWNFSYTHVFFVGNNGQGKTNLLEAIYCLFRGASFRTMLVHQLCAHATNTMWLRGGSNDGERILYAYDAGRRRIEVNDTLLRARSPLVIEYPCVPFVTSDIKMVMGSPEEKRSYMNQCILIVDTKMAIDFSRFQKFLKQRNAALKHREYKLLPAITTEYIRTGLVIQEQRRNLIESYAPEITRLIDVLSGGTFSVSIEYRSSWKSCDYESIHRQLTAEGQKEMVMQCTQSGPHRDTYELYLNGIPVQACASMGQQRIIALTLRMIQAYIYYKVHGKKPLYLFDDVLLELDDDKKKHFVQHLSPYEQAFFTFLPSESLTLFHSETNVEYHISAGRAI